MFFVLYFLVLGKLWCWKETGQQWKVETCEADYFCLKNVLKFAYACYPKFDAEMHASFVV